MAAAVCGGSGLRRLRFAAEAVAAAVRGGGSQRRSAAAASGELIYIYIYI